MAQYRTFERTIAELTAQGYEVIWERGNEAQLRRRKRFSFWWFLFWTVFSLGILFWLYPLWHWAKRDELVSLRMEGGRLLVTSNRWQLLQTISARIMPESLEGVKGVEARCPLSAAVRRGVSL